MHIVVEVGQRYGRLTVLSDAGRIGAHRHYRCTCDCGQLATVSKYRLASGHTRSCGCIHSEGVSRRNTKHSMAGTPTYRVWKGMMARCYQPSADRFDQYGGRGISVCDRWHSFPNFFADMGQRPPGMSIDRIDVDSGYGPGSCRWATAVQQAQNKTNNRRVTVGGVTKCLMEWQRSSGIDRRKIADRLNRGWPPERAITP